MRKRMIYKAEFRKSQNHSRNGIAEKLREKSQQDGNIAQYDAVTYSI